MARSTLLLALSVACLSLVLPLPLAAQRDRGGGSTPFSLGLEVRQERRSVVVTRVVPGGLGEAAGVVVDDAIVSLAGQAIAAVADISRCTPIIVKERAASLAVAIVVRRGGQTLTLTFPAPGGAGTAAPAPATGPWLGLGLADPPADWEPGAVVSHVVIDAPGDVAGVRAGDVVTALNGAPVRGSAELQQAAGRLAAGQPVPLALRRGTRALALTVIPRDRTAPVRRARRPLAEINVLTHAVIDPETRAVTLIGKYDPAFATGPLPYDDYLQEALRNPYPSFSLEPTKDTRAAVARLDAGIAADVRKMHEPGDYAATWMQRLLKLLLQDPTVAREGVLFVSKGATLFRISEAEMRKMLMKAANLGGATEEEMAPILGKALCGLGYTQVGEALQTNDPTGMAPFEKMGVKEQAVEIRNRFNAGALSREQAGIQLAVLLDESFLRGLHVPEVEIQAKIKPVLAGRASPEALHQYLSERVQGILVDQVGVKLFHGFTLTPALLSRLYNVPAPQVAPVFKNLTADSLLGDVLYRADLALKTICTDPGIAQWVPGFQTEMEFLYAAAAAQGVRLPGDAGAEAGHRLRPGEVRMRVSPAGAQVAFDAAQVKIDGWVIRHIGNSGGRKVEQLVKEGVEGYGNYLTTRYDALARVFPDLHRFREAEKVIALARWAAKNRYTLVVEGATGARIPPPTTVPGFCQAVFTADPQEVSLTLIVEGGATFAKDEGDDWVAPTVQPAVTADIARQLVMSAALAGEAALTALGGDLEAARLLAEKCARAMTGDIDLAALPALGDLPLPADPAQVVTLSTAALDAVDRVLTQAEEARATAVRADALAGGNPEEAARLRAQAAESGQLANARLQRLRDALNDARRQNGQTAAAVAAIRNLGTVTVPPGTAANPATPPVTPPTSAAGALTPAERERMQRELAQLRTEVEATQAQFAKLTRAIQADRGQFEDWEKVATSGMERCTGVLYNLLMDASAAQLASRYETMSELAQKLPDKPQPLIDRLGRIKNWFKAMGATQAMKDVADVAGREGKTLPELLEEVRDDLNIIAAVTGLDKTVAGAAWKQGTSIVELAFSYAQFSAAWDGITRMDKQNEEYRKAIAALSSRMEKLVTRIREIRQALGE